MTRQFAFVLVLIAVLFAGRPSVAQGKPYDQLMKEVGATFASLKKNLDSNAAGAAAEDAAKLESLLRETEAFWTPFRTKDALDAAKGARDATAAVAAAARNNDMTKAQTSYGGIGRYCAGCHNSHREQMPDKSYRIKP